MANTQSLSIYTTADAKAYLKNVIVGEFSNLGKATLSGRFKSRNANLNAKAGSYEFKRYANATSQDYGTARTAGKGQIIKAPAVTVNLDTNKEIVEEVNFFDAESFTEDSFEQFIERRKRAIALSVERELDRSFFAAIKSDGTDAGVTIDTAKALVPQLESIILKLETTQNDYVDGVDRELMAFVLSPELYGKVKTELNDCYNFSGTVADEVFKGINGVATFSSNRLPAGVDYELLVSDSVAQPVQIVDTKVEQIPLSNEYAVEVFYRFGTKAIAPELTLYGAVKTA